MNNDALMADLSRWAREDARIDPNAFGCRFYDQCNASIGGALCRGKFCMMSYVGRHYGDDGTFRLAVVGMDHGDPKGGNFDQRREGIEAVYQHCRDNRLNPHYEGVVKTAMAVFGSAGNHCRCTTSCQKLREPSAFCVIDRI